MQEYVQIINKDTYKGKGRPKKTDYKTIVSMAYLLRKQGEKIMRLFEQHN